MKPFSKCYYLNACGLLLAGLIVTGISVGAGAWNAEKYGEALNLKDRYFEVTEPFTSMQLISNTANVVVKATDTDTCTVTATNMPENTIKVTVEDDKLCINAVPEHRKWYQYFQMGVNPPTSTITLSLPMNVYEQVELQNDIGNLTLQNVHADRISLKVTPEIWIYNPSPERAAPSQTILAASHFRKYRYGNKPIFSRIPVTWN